VAEFESVTPADEAVLTALLLNDKFARQGLPYDAGLPCIVLDIEMVRRIQQELGRICYLIDPNDAEAIRDAYRAIRKANNK